MPSFSEYQASLIPAPPNDPLTEYQGILGSKKDEFLAAGRTAIKDRFIQKATDDALPYLGVNANTPKPESMTNDQYRDKLAKTWDRWISSGTPNRLIADLKELGFTGNITIVPVWTLIGPNKYVNTLDVQEINPALENSWGTFWVVVDQPHGYQVVNWGAPQWGNFVWGEVVGDKVKLARMVSIIKQLKPAWTCCRGIVFMQGAAKLWDVINWGGANFNGNFGIYRIRENWE